MNDLQSRTAKAIVNIFETGRVHGDYGAVTVITGDSGHLTYGRTQTTLGSGNLFLLIRSYCARPDARCASELSPFLPALGARDVSLDRNMTLRGALQAAGADPAMQNEQDRFFDEVYFDPAIAAAAARGITDALGQTVVYDSMVHGGFDRVAGRVGVEIVAGGTGGAGGIGGVDQREWVQRYVSARRTWLQSLNDPLPKTTYRMDAFDALIAAGAWDLPLDLNVRGVTISPATLDDTSVIIRAAATEPGDPPPPPILFLTSPFMKGDDVRRVQEALKTNGFDTAPDGIYGPVTEARVRQFQRQKGLRVDGIVGPATRAALGL